MRWATIWLLITGFFLVAFAGPLTTANVFDYWEIIVVWGAGCIVMGLLGVLNLLYGNWFH